MKAISFSFVAALALWLTSCTPTTTTPYSPTGTSNVVTTVGTTTSYRAVYAFSFGSLGSGAGQFTALSGLLVLPDGTALFTTEYGTTLGTARIQKLTPSGASFNVPNIVTNGAGATQRVRFINFVGGTNFIWGMDNRTSVVCFSVASLATNNFQPSAWGTSAIPGEVNNGTTAQNQNTGPGGVAYDSLGRWWLADLGNSRVQIFTNTNAIGVSNFYSQIVNAFWVNSFGTFTTFSGPTSVRMDFNGNMAVVDSANSRVVILNPLTGTVVNQIAGGGSSANILQMNRPMDVATNTKQQYFVTDFLNNRVVRFDANCAFLESFGSFGSGAGQFNGPVGIAIDQYDTIYVADQANGRIQVWSNVATTTTYTNNQTIWQ
ncbi:MAG: hypothetical protein JNM63_07495 [Spirochaetia bacterium]|nr:hypothetical protein [Spirochaetia bacterium]